MIKLYCIKDTKIGFTTALFTKPNDDLAKRDFSYLVNQPGTVIANNPEDFELYCLGEFNADSGIITSNISFVCNAISLVKSYGEGFPFAPKVIDNGSSD